MKHCYFVAGTDTDVGKTFASAALLTRAGRRGLRTVACKPVAAGAEQTPDGLRNEDALTLISACNQPLDYAVVNPLCLAAPIAPHIAAAEQGVDIRAARILASFDNVARDADFIVVEGAGGWRVPLNDSETMADIAIALDIPVLLVVAMRLGCISHALLSAEAILHDGLRLAGWIANQVSAVPMARHDENVATLVSLLPAPLLGEIPFVPGGQYQHAADFVRLPDQLETEGFAL